MVSYVKFYLKKKKLTVGILSERRVFSPYGLLGGENGKKGKNLLYKNDGQIYNLTGKNSFNVEKNDIFTINEEFKSPSRKIKIPNLILKQIFVFDRSDCLNMRRSNETSWFWSNWLSLHRW